MNEGWKTLASLLSVGLQISPQNDVLTCSLFLHALSPTLSIWRGRLIWRPAKLAALHLTRVWGLHYDGRKPLGQLGIPFMGLREVLFEVYVRLTEGVWYLWGSEHAEKIGLRKLYQQADFSLWSLILRRMLSLFLQWIASFILDKQLCERDVKSGTVKLNVAWGFDSENRPIFTFTSSI